ncbi:MAG: glutathione S-transferase family protein [Alphaproteobacteria bacterium]|nr:glutathione S-transferase family protein [Alphaproteobacteria bacterium]
MYRLYHHPICPFSRKVRTHLAAKEIGIELVQENFWERKKEFIAMNPAGTVPVLFDNGNAAVIAGSSVIIEYIEEKHKETKSLLGDSVVERAEVRRLQSWFDEKFFHEVGRYVLNERYFNRYFSASNSPSSEILRAARRNLNSHLSYIEYLLESRKYLAGERISVADFAAACQISVLDYFGDINWHHYAPAKDWYSLIKSHKIFSDILKDRVAGIAPSEWYAKLDF